MRRKSTIRRMYPTARKAQRLANSADLLARHIQSLADELNQLEFELNALRTGQKKLLDMGVEPSEVSATEIEPLDFPE